MRSTIPYQVSVLLVTLALSALDVVRVQQRPVEILIALSIGVLA